MFIIVYMPEKTQSTQYSNLACSDNHYRTKRTRVLANIRVRVRFHNRSIKIIFIIYFALKQ